MGYEVKNGSLSIGNVYQGIALREETIVTSNDSGYINYYAREGERVGFGKLVCSIDECGQLKEMFDAGKADDTQLSDNNLADIKSEITGYMSGFEKKQFDGAGTRFETKKWDGTKSFMDGKTEVPDFIAHAKGVNTGTWQDATKQYAMRKAEIQGRTWKEADKQFGHEINRDIDAKRKNFEQPSMMSIREAQAHTIQETREMMGRTD